jgi:hypothetical protein
MHKTIAPLCRLEQIPIPPLAAMGLEIVVEAGPTNRLQARLLLTAYKKSEPYHIVRKLCAGSRTRDTGPRLERFRAEWNPVRVKKTRQNQNPESTSVSMKS